MVWNQINYKHKEQENVQHFPVSSKWQISSRS